MVPKLDSYAEQIDKLAPAPRILTELLPLLRGKKSDAQEIVDVIKFDPSLTARALRHCNSASSGLGVSVESVGDAVTRLGFNAIYRLVAVAVGESALGAEQKGYGMAPGDLWRHSAAVAVAARTVAKSVETDEDAVFTSGLLHDIGKTLLNARLAGVYPAVEVEIVTCGKSFLEAERAVFGTDHAELGGRALTRWNFPASLVSAVRYHHDPAQATPFEQMAALVHIGDIIAHTLGYGDGYSALATRGKNDALEILEITGKELDLFILRTNEALSESTWFVANES